MWWESGLIRSPNKSARKTLIQSCFDDTVLPLTCEWYAAVLRLQGILRSARTICFRAVLCGLWLFRGVLQNERTTFWERLCKFFGCDVGYEFGSMCGVTCAAGKTRQELHHSLMSLEAEGVVKQALIIRNVNFQFRCGRSRNSRNIGCRRCCGRVGRETTELSHNTFYLLMATVQVRLWFVSIICWTVSGSVSVRCEARCRYPIKLLELRMCCRKVEKDNLLRCFCLLKRDNTGVDGGEQVVQ